MRGRGGGGGGLEGGLMWGPKLQPAHASLKKRIVSAPLVCIYVGPGHSGQIKPVRGQVRVGGRRGGGSNVHT